MNQSEADQLRREYEHQGLDGEDLAGDPMTQFGLWYSGAVTADLEEPNAFVLTTATPDGRPSARAVLMKGQTKTSIVFYSNLGSRKGVEISSNPRVAATFVWIPLHRQVRFEGIAKQVSEDIADAYFATRPRGAQIAAHASHQSKVVASREVLEAKYVELDATFGETIPRPAWWGGWEIAPERAEFWQGRPNRFHDRLGYVKDGDHWTIERLQP